MSDAALRFTVAEDRRLEIAPEMVALLSSYAQVTRDVRVRRVESLA